MANSINNYLRLNIHGVCRGGDFSLKCVFIEFAIPNVANLQSNIVEKLVLKLFGILISELFFVCYFLNLKKDDVICNLYTWPESLARLRLPSWRRRRGPFPPSP